jgi:hypothetical protein
MGCAKSRAARLDIFSCWRMPVFLTQLQIAQCTFLIAASRMFRHYGVTVLLDSCLADKLAFAERTKMLIREIAEFKGTEGLSASAAA